MKIYETIHPEDGSATPVRTYYTAAAAIRLARSAYPLRRGPDPRTDDQCLDDFIVVNWAETLEVLE